MSFFLLYIADLIKSMQNLMKWNIQVACWLLQTLVSSILLFTVTESECLRSNCFWCQRNRILIGSDCRLGRFLVSEQVMIVGWAGWIHLHTVTGIIIVNVLWWNNCLWWRLKRIIENLNPWLLILQHDHVFPTTCICQDFKLSSSLDASEKNGSEWLFQRLRE